MAYEVVYEKGKQKRGKSRRGILTLGAFLLFLLLVHTYWPEGQAVLRRLLLPGDPVITTSAIQDLVRDLKAGAVFPDAWEAFCQEVIQGAQSVLH